MRNLMVTDVTVNSKRRWNALAPSVSPATGTGVTGAKVPASPEMTAPAWSRTLAESNSTENNIEKIVRLEGEAEQDRGIVERLSETIGHFVGTVSFVVVQVTFVTGWIVANTWLTTFDPFPFPFLVGILGYEAVILTAFVLIRQNRMSLRADRRNHLALQVNLLSEQEATKIIQMLERMSRQLGMEHQVTDKESRELSGDTSIDTIARDLRHGMEEKAEGKKPKGEG
jgi:uncharacterized membrane protein